MDPATPNESRRTSSVYSGVSATAARLNTNGNGIGSSNANGYASRPASTAAPYVPSYMSHVPSRSQTSSLSIKVPRSPADPQPAVELPANEPSTVASHGQLLVLAAGVHESTLSYLEMLVSRQPFSGIILVGGPEQEAALKALKMDCFALIGRLSKEMSVSTHFQDQWSQGDVEDTLQQITKTGESIQGVLCCPASDQSGTASDDVLIMDAGQLQKALTRNVAFVHGATKAILPHLLSRCKSGGRKPVRPPQGPFFLVTEAPAYSAASQIAKSACDTFLSKLETSIPRSQGLTIAYAEAVLIPDPVQVEEHTSKATSGPFLQPAETYSHGQYEPPESDYISPESPTKLWALFNAANIE